MHMIAVRSEVLDWVVISMKMKGFFAKYSEFAGDATRPPFPVECGEESKGK